MVPVSTAWLITGLPGAGKSTVARLLASAMTRAAHVQGDLLQEMIVSGAVWPSQKSDDAEAASRQYVLNVCNECLVAVSFAEAGFVPVIEEMVSSRSTLQRYRQQLASLSLSFVVLHPGWEVALQRDRDRPKETVGAASPRLEGEMVSELGCVGLWVENASLSAAETVRFILQHQERARL